MKNGIVNAKDYISEENLPQEDKSEYEISQVCNERIIFVWGIIHNKAKIDKCISKALFPSADNNTFCNIETKYTILHNSPFNKEISYQVLSPMCFEILIRLLSNTFECNTVLSICVYKNKKDENEKSYQTICESLSTLIPLELSMNTESIKHYESTIIKTNITKLWKFITNWEFDKIKNFDYSNFFFSEDPLVKGTEIRSVCDNEFNSLCKVENVENDPNNNTWRYDIVPIDCRLHASEIHFVMIKVSEDITFLSFEHVFRYRITSEIEIILSKMKNTLFTGLKQLLE